MFSTIIEPNNLTLETLCTQPCTYQRFEGLGFFVENTAFFCMVSMLNQRPDEGWKVNSNGAIIRLLMLHKVRRVRSQAESLKIP